MVFQDKKIQETFTKWLLSARECAVTWEFKDEKDPFWSMEACRDAIHSIRSFTKNEEKAECRKELIHLNWHLKDEKTSLDRQCGQTEKLVQAQARYRRVWVVLEKAMISGSGAQGDRETETGRSWKDVIPWGWMLILRNEERLKTEKFRFAL